MKTIAEVNNRHHLDIENLKSDYRKELQKLNDYQDHVKPGKKEVIKAKHIEKLKALQTTKEKYLKEIHSQASNKVKEVKSYNDLSHNEMIYLSTILNGGNVGQIQNIASQYINNEAVREMVKASVNKLDNKQAVLNVIDSFASGLEEVEQALANLNTQNITEEFGIFNRIV